MDTLWDSSTSTKGEAAPQVASLPGDSISDLDTTFSHVFRPAHDDQRGSVFFGDSANESFLQQIRQLAASALGSCPFVEEPIQYHANHSTSIPILTSLEGMIKPPPKPSPAQAKYFVSWSMRATSNFLCVFREVDIQNQVAQWLEQRNEMTTLLTALCFVILANGALSCPEDEDTIADAYFSYACHLANLRSMEEPSLMSVLCHSWIAFYQLNAGARDAAYQSAGVACRSACAIGIHSENQLSFGSQDKCAFRDQLWKALRILDIFTSGPLGRPMCTTETRNTKVEQGYSASIDLAAILNAVLSESCRPSTMSRHFIANMTQEHRSWAARMSSGLEADGIESAELTEGCENKPSLGFSNIQQSYYWSIMLLTRPILLERASTWAIRADLNESYCRDQGEAAPVADSDTAVLYASVDSAVRTIRLLQGLLARVDLPKRLPFQVNSAFTAALTLVVATFADLDRLFPLRQNLKFAEGILQKLGKHDSIARSYRRIVGQLQSTCDEYIEERTNRIMEKQNRLVGGLFGRLHDKPLSSKEKVDRTNVGRVDEPATTQELLSQQGDLDSLTTICLTDEPWLGADPVDMSGIFLDLPLGFPKGSQLINATHIGNGSDAEGLALSGFSSFP